jgi:hypothetical protein
MTVACDGIGPDCILLLIGHGYGRRSLALGLATWDSGGGRRWHRRPRGTMRRKGERREAKARRGRWIRTQVIHYLLARRRIQFVDGGRTFHPYGNTRLIHGNTTDLPFFRWSDHGWSPSMHSMHSMHSMQSTPNISLDRSEETESWRSQICCMLRRQSTWQTQMVC